MRHMLLGAAAALALAATPVLADFPEKAIDGTIQWGAGGSTDTVMRAVAPHAEKALGGEIVMTNRTGGVGAIGAQHVLDQDADGYTLLMGAENPQLYKVMGIAEFDYSDFIPVNILARGIPLLVARTDAPFNTMAEFIAYAQAHPGEVRVGSTGPGGLPSVVMAMLTSATDLPLTAVPFDGDGPALTALQGGAIDVQPAVLGAAIEHVRAGRMKVLAVIDVAAPAALPDAEPVTAVLPDLAKFLPWGPFFGVFVKAGTPDDVVAKLTAAFAEGAQAEDFKALIDARGFEMLSLSGDEARAFLANWQSVTSWLVYDAGIAKASPEDFGIPRP